MSDVFISYARSDKKRVGLLAQALEAEGFSVWWDAAIKPGKDWHDVIRKNLDETHCVVVCWTKASVKSDWVLAETTQAYNRGKLVPVLLQRSEPPIPYNMVQSADLAAWRGAADDPNWTGALHAIRRLVEAGRGKLYGAVPPPSDAQAATEVLRPAPSVSAAPTPSIAPHFPPRPAPEPEPEFESAAYEISPARKRMGPRAGQLFLGALGVTALLSGGLWAGPELVRLANTMDLSALATSDAPPEEPAIVFDVRETAALPPLEALAADLAVIAPTVKFAKFAEEPAPPKAAEPAPAPDKPPVKPPALTPPLAPVTGTDAQTTLPNLERCLGSLAKMCPSIDPKLTAGFAVDGALRTGERLLLLSPLFPEPGRVTPANLSACRAALTAGPKARPTAAACAAIAAETKPPEPTTPPEQKPPLTGTISPIKPSVVTVPDKTLRPILAAPPATVAPATVAPEPAPVLALPPRTVVAQPQEAEPPR